MTGGRAKLTPAVAADMYRGGASACQIAQAYGNTRSGAEARIRANHQPAGRGAGRPGSRSSVFHGNRHTAWCGGILPPNVPPPPRASIG
jgi:hypothetical protein